MVDSKELISRQASDEYHCGFKHAMHCRVTMVRFTIGVGDNCSNGFAVVA